jgi:phospholipid/cholesterol/gamma-HCH transport system permease protein
VGVMARVDQTGRSVEDFVLFFRDVAVLSFGALKTPFVQRTRGFRLVWEIFLAQVRFTGAQGVSLSAFAALALGTLVLIESVQFIPDSTLVPKVIGLVMIKDVAPLLTALVIIGRSGTAISVELANMKLNGEIDALISMGVPLEHIIVLPRLLGAMISFVGMVICAQASALVGGYVVASYVIHIPFTLTDVIDNVHFGDVFNALGKAAIMGGAISIICIREGLSVKVSQREVPQAATRAVVRAMVFCLVVNSFLSIYA